MKEGYSITDKAIAYVWLTIAIVCLIGVICGAWWHLFTTAFCLLLSRANYPILGD